MVNDYILMIDSDSDLPFHLQEKLNIPVVYMPYTIKGVEYFASLGKNASLSDFYNKMRSGEVPSTNCLSTVNYIEYFEPYLEQGKDILFIAFSSQLSTTINNIYEARSILKEKYPNSKIEVVDTLTISFPETILILCADKMYKAGATIEEIIDWLENNKLKAQVYLTVDDLIYFKRGGRINGIQAFMGKLLDLKPVITINKEGKIVPIEKIKGRKKAISCIVNYLKENIENAENQEVFVFHADSVADAENLANHIKEILPQISNINIEFIGEVIGSHCGPGTIGVAFLGKERPF